jgi:hypothetical protein
MICSGKKLEGLEFPVAAGYVFGTYTSEGWKVAPRYYGSGESFVFQLEVWSCSEDEYAMCTCVTRTAAGLTLSLSRIKLVVVDGKVTCC